jgi:serine/threonine-protein kinase HipA
MSDRIGIYHHQELVGHLSTDKYGTLIFQYASSYLDLEKSVAISVSLPLTTDEFYGNSAHTFFNGLLPEDQELIQIARIIGTDPGNSFRLLKELGREAIGGLAIGAPAQDGPHNYRFISKEELRSKFRSIANLASDLYQNENLRLSLAGAQSKFSALYENEKIYLPINGATSDTIIKPQSKNYKNLVENEFLTMQLASLCGIRTAKSFIIDVDGELAYAVKRFDRERSGTQLVRLLQEDFCQASSILPINKYEKDGGPGFSSCIRILKDHSSRPAVEIPHFIDLFIFNYIVGNRDAHGKNFSLLHKNGLVQLAPAYDLVCTSLFPELSTDMAMSIDGIYSDELVTRSNFIQMAKLAGVSSKILLHRIEFQTSSIMKMNPQLKNNNKINQIFTQSYIDHIIGRCKMISKSLEWD